MRKHILYYSCLSHPPAIEYGCRLQLLQAAGDIPIGSVTLNQPVEFGIWNVVVQGQRSALTMHRQILAGLERSVADVIYFAENDVLYHKTHFDFTPERPDAYYYNLNVWKMRYSDGHSVKVDFCQQNSGLCAHRDLLVEHYRKRVARIEREGWSLRMGYEPGTHKTPRGVDDYPALSWESEFPNIDIRHEQTFTPSRWSPDKFRNKRFAAGWQERDDALPGWGSIPAVLAAIKDSP